jgi:uncharacterized protein YdeI (YjbR/CyaY-like superfamily)
MATHRAFHPTLLAGLAVFALAGCQSSTGPSDGRESAVRQAWMERRAAQIGASGVKAAEATAKAAAEWSALTGEQREAILFSFNASAKEKAEQQKVKEGFEQLARER